MKNVFSAVICLLGMSIAGCAPITPVPEYPQLYIGPNAQQYVQTTDLRFLKNESNLLQVAYDGASSFNREIKYRFVWFDSNGFELPSITGRWQLRQLGASQPFTIQAIATSPKAVNFRLLIYDKSFRPLPDDRVK